MSSLDRDAFIDGFVVEAEEHLGSVARHLATIAEAPATAHPRPVREIYRSLHTIKGLSGMVGIEAIVDVAHAMEAVVRAGDRAGGRLSARAVDLLVDGVRAIEQRLRRVAERTAVPAAPSPLIEALTAMDAPVAAPAAIPLAVDEPLLTASEREQIAQGVAAGRTCSRVDVVTTQARSAAGLTITAVRERVARVGEIVRILPRAMRRGDSARAGIGFTLYVLHDGDAAAVAEAAGVDVSQVTPMVASISASPAPGAPEDPLAAEPAEPGDPGDASPDSTGDRVVRVEVARLDDVLEQLSAVVVTRFRLERAIADLAAAGADVRALQAIASESSRQLRDLRGAVMRARMVSVAELLERVPLMVRGLTRGTGKTVALAIDAGRAELDKAVGGRIFPAIVHLVRNAVDHGIEPTDERRAAGKPVDGHIRVACHDRSNNQLELTISDDGRGIDAALLARRAGRPVPTTDEGLLHLLATPGLSSRSEASTTSGRGLGVDIVLRIVRDLGGELRVASRPGQGTTFTMWIPLSITIVEAFSFEAAGQVFLVPVAAVEEILEVDPARTTRAPQRRGLRAEVSLIERRGTALPLVGLDEVFSLRRETAPAPVLAGLRPKAFVVRRGGAPCAFRVDRVLGQQEVVVRPLVDELVKVAGVTGSTDLGDGRPVLVLDLVALADRLVDAPDARGPAS
jgi:two-component system, chemotaxis family, sensor kinase CheA